MLLFVVGKVNEHALNSHRITSTSAISVGWFIRQQQ